jgi:nucleotide-binding universal stress UspA family protein
MLCPTGESYGPAQRWPRRGTPARPGQKGTLDVKIGIAVDGSSSSRAGVELVSSLPLSWSDRISVISVAEPPTMLAPPVAGFRQKLLELSHQRADRFAEHAVERLVGLPCPVAAVVSRGHPGAVLTCLAGELDLDLLVIGPRGAGRIGSILLGSVSQALLHAMPTSILVARAPTGAPRRVLVAADGSSPSAAAVTFLGGFPLPPGVDLRLLVSVTCWTDEYRGIEGRDWFDLIAAERKHALAIAERMIEKLERQGRTCAPIIRDGDPKREILDAALEIEADLIVTGSRGLGGFKGLVLGSVSRAVSKAAPCSVLVVGGAKAVPAGEQTEGER